LLQHLHHYWHHAAPERLCSNYALHRIVPGFIGYATLKIVFGYNEESDVVE
jgi:hypothetical protein